MWMMWAWRIIGMVFVLTSIIVALTPLKNVETQLLFLIGGWVAWLHSNHLENK